MDSNKAEDSVVYKVLVNHEEQYSIWPSQKANPLGWRDASKSGSKAECLAHIGQVWTDMRPSSLRHQNDGNSQANRLSRSQQRDGLRYTKDTGT
jgi:MbtH protein